MNTYVFKIELEQEEDGRWSATVPALPGCFSWGYTREEALETIEENVRAWLEVLRDKGEPFRELVRARERDGFYLERSTRGGGHIYYHPDGRMTMVHYHHGSDTLTRKTLKSFLEQTGGTKEDLRRLRLA